MSIKNEVCSLELTKKLLDIGLEPKNMFWWINTINDEWNVCVGDFADDPREKFPTFTLNDLFMYGFDEVNSNDNIATHYARIIVNTKIKSEEK